MQLPLEITFRNLDASPAVEARIRKCADKLESVCDRITRCHVVVEAPTRRQRQGAPFRVRLRITVPGDEIVVSRDRGPANDQAHQDIYTAVRDSFDAARRQLLGVSAR